MISDEVKKIRAERAERSKLKALGQWPPAAAPEKKASKKAAKKKKK